MRRALKWQRSSLGRALVSSRSNEPPKTVVSVVGNDTANDSSVKFKDRYGDLLSVSTEVMGTVIAEALQRRDSKTLHLLIAQANKVGNLSINVLEDSIKKCFALNDFDNAAIIVQSCGLLSASGKGVVSQGVCEDLLGALVDHYKWTQASIVLDYMVRCDIPCTSGDRHAFHVIAGLMKDVDGVVRALQLMTTITEKRRTDLAMLVNFKKANRFASSWSDRRVFGKRQALPKEALEHFAEASLRTLQSSGWFSFTLSKMLIVLACGSNNHELAINYINKVVEHIAKANSGSVRSENSPSVDVLSVLRGFSQGAGIASEQEINYKVTWDYSPVSRTILDLAVDELKRGNIPIKGPLRTTEFFKMYWVLCYRAGRPNSNLATLNINAEGTDKLLKASSFIPPSPSPSPLPLPLLINPVLRSSYDELVAFIAQSEVKSMISRPAPGYHRRAFRILCDELGVRHKLGKFEDSHSRNDAVRVWKEAGSMSQPPTLEDILAADARRGSTMRKFDGIPLHWDQVIKLLQRQLPAAVPNVIGALVGYPSSEWGLLALQQLYELSSDGISHSNAQGASTSSAAEDEEEEVPTRMLRNLIRMCSERSDVYGLLEVLHMSSERTNNHERLRNREQGAPPKSRGSDGGFFPLEDPGTYGLRPADWNLACNIAYRSRLANIPTPSFDAAFAEVVRLMREANVDFEDGTTRTLLRYLVYSQPESELTGRIIRRLHRDKSVKLSHIECAALSLLMLQRISAVYDTNKIVLARPLYKAEAYLVLYPEGFSYMMDVVVKHSDFFGDAFLRGFESAWSLIHSAQGRTELYDLLAKLTSSAEGGKRKELVQDPRGETRGAAVVLCIYSAYLVSFFDGNYRKAFDLLVAAEAIHQEAKVFARESEEARTLWSADDHP